MVRKSKGKGNAERLAPAQWIDAGLRTLGERGVTAVRVEPLARSLGVTKGSFYWHFKDRRALLDAMLERWRQLATDAIIEQVDAKGGTAAQRVAHLFRITTTGQGDRIEAALRAWAIEDPAAAAALAEVDELRQRYVTDLLVEHGIPRAEARRRARIAYLVLIGEFTWVAHGGEPSPKGVFTTLTRMVLSAMAALLVVSCGAPSGDAASSSDRPSTPPSSSRVCAHLEALWTRELAGEPEHPVPVALGMLATTERCHEWMEGMRREDPQGHAQRASCMLAATELDAAARCMEAVIDDAAALAVCEQQRDLLARELPELQIEGELARKVMKQCVDVWRAQRAAHPQAFERFAACVDEAESLDAANTCEQAYLAETGETLTAP